MRRVLMCSLLLTLTACSKTESGSSKAPESGSAAAPGSAVQTGSPAPAPADAAPAPAEADGKDEVAQLVVASVGSKALGSQTIDPGCVTVVLVPAGDWTIASAWLKGCGDKIARSILWVYKRKTGAWNEDYVGQPPKCWKGVPPDIAPSVSIATKIPSC